MEKDQFSTYHYWSSCSSVKRQRVGIRSPMDLCYPHSRIKAGGKQTHVALGLSWAAFPYCILRTGFSGWTRELPSRSIIQGLKSPCILKLDNPKFPNVLFSSGVSILIRRTSEKVCLRKDQAAGAKCRVRAKQICSMGSDSGLPSPPRAPFLLMCRRERDHTAFCHPQINSQMQMAKDQELRWDISFHHPGVPPTSKCGHFPNSVTFAAFKFIMLKGLDVLCSKTILSVGKCDSALIFLCLFGGSVLHLTMCWILEVSP